MFNKGFTILTISRNEIIVSDPSVKSADSSGSSYPWTEKSILQVVKQILEEHPTKKVRVLLQDDMCYCIQVTPGQSDEAVISEGQKRIPEIFTENDIRISQLPKSKKKVLMVPIIDLWTLIHKSLSESGVTTELFCSVQEAQEYGSSATEGISVMEALKKDKLYAPVKKDEEEAQKDQDALTEPESLSPQKAQTNLKKFLLYGLIVVLIVLIGFMGYVVWEMSPPPAPQPEVSQTVTPTKTPTPTLPPVDISIIRVQVLNATGQAGVAGTVAEELSRQGFVTVDTGNAPPTEQGINTIAIREATQAAVLIPTVQSILKDYEFDNVGTPLDNDKYDLQVIIGK